MNQRLIYSLIHRILAHESSATTPEKRKYWDAQWRRFRALAVKIGWID